MCGRAEGKGAWCVEGGRMRDGNSGLSRAFVNPYDSQDNEPRPLTSAGMRPVAWRGETRQRSQRDVWLSRRMLERCKHKPRLSRREGGRIRRDPRSGAATMTRREGELSQGDARKGKGQ